MFRDASLLAEHQSAAVERLMQILDHWGGAILADEPGLGKSFVAAEIARRESERGTAVEVIVPSALVPQWRETLASFSVAACVTTHARVSVAHERLSAQRFLIVDEAHAFRNPRTQRFAALARRSIGARMLLVTATPVCNSAADLEALLRLIVCDDALASRGVPSIDLAFARRDRELLAIIVSSLVVHRDKTVLPPALAFGDLERRVMRFAIRTAEIDRLLAELQLPLVAGQPLVRDFLRRRLESSAAALQESLRRQTRFYERVLECLASGRALPKRDYRRAFGHEEDRVAFQTVLFWDLFAPEGLVVRPEEIKAELSRIQMLRTALDALPATKEEIFLEICRKTEQPILLFTGWTATARALFAVLRKIRRVALVTGRERSNASAIDAFRRGVADVLISTDVGAEGLNLQRAAIVIHYDIPWNPVRLDQRNGRAHRIGQERGTVRAIYFLPDGRRGKVLHTVAAKNRIRRQLISREVAPAMESLSTLTLPPRVTAESAAARLAAAATRARLPLAKGVDRRHRAGVELVLQEMAAGPLDGERIREIERLVASEPWGGSRRR